MKARHKQIYLQKVILPNMCNRGFGESIIVGKELVSVAYMTIPDLKRVWRKEGENGRTGRDMEVGSD